MLYSFDNPKAKETHTVKVTVDVDPSKLSAAGEKAVEDAEEAAAAVIE